MTCADSGIYCPDGRRSRAPRDPCVPRLQDPGEAGSPGRRVALRHVPPGLSRQRRHPGDARRRGEGRRLTRVTILLVRPRLIGDVILTTPSVQALRHRFPDAKLLYLVEALAAPVVSNNPRIDQTFVMRHRRGWRRWLEDLRLARQLRAQRIDVAIDMHGGPRSGWLTWATRAPMRVGYDVSGRRWMYTHRIARPRGYQPRPSVLNQWDLVAPVVGSPAELPSPERERVEMPVTE